uniref:TMF_TATA_bd domain-containing protein n=1 Tax=Rhabditophanes sp. KR3021 TaxID=114890 RepID=A0AC35U5D0_9BILA
MSFSWAGKLAKTALLTAQQKIDQVLEITTEEDAEEETITPKNELNDIEIKQEENVGDKYVGEDIIANKMVETGLKINLVTDNWDCTEKQNQIVVESEPNPSRDENTPGTISNIDSSPCSNSPNHESSNQESSEKEKDRSENKSWEPDIIVSRKNLAQDILETDTIASSDIEVIKHSDEWSTMSSHPQSMTNLSIVEKRIDKALNRTIDTSTEGKEMMETIQNLKIQLQMRDRRIEELSTSIRKGDEERGMLKKNYKSIEKELKESNKVKKVCKENEKLISELKDEGKMLSEKLGQKDKELKKMRISLNDHTQAKTDLTKLQNEIKQLKVSIETKNSEIKKLQSSNIEETNVDKIEIARLTKVVQDLQNNSKTQENFYVSKVYDVEQIKTDLEEERNTVSTLKIRLVASNAENAKLQNVLHEKDEKNSRDNLHLTIAIANLQDEYANSTSNLEKEKMALLEKINELEKNVRNKQINYDLLIRKTESLSEEITKLKSEKLKEAKQLNKLMTFVEKYKACLFSNDKVNAIMTELDCLDSRISSTKRDITLINKKYDLMKERNKAIQLSEQHNLYQNESGAGYESNEDSMEEISVLSNIETDQSFRRSSDIEIGWYTKGACNNCDTMFRYAEDIRNNADTSVSNKMHALQSAEECKKLKAEYDKLSNEFKQNEAYLEEALQMLGEKIEIIEEMKQDFIDMEKQQKQTMFDLLQKFEDGKQQNE